MTSSLVPRPITELGAELQSRLLDLNNANAVETSHLEPAEWAQMTSGAFLAEAIGTEAFLIAFDQTAAYDSQNFLWFRNRFERFVYVDRVIVDSAARGRGHARRLYETLFGRASTAGHSRVVCEVNRVPPNPGSDAFHAALGFTELATVQISPERTVRYLERPLR